MKAVVWNNMDLRHLQAEGPILETMTDNALSGGVHGATAKLPGSV